MSFRCLIYMEKAKTSLNVTDCNLFLSLSLREGRECCVQSSGQASRQSQSIASPCHANRSPPFIFGTWLLASLQPHVFPYMSLFQERQ